VVKKKGDELKENGFDCYFEVGKRQRYPYLRHKGIKGERHVASSILNLGSRWW
jgi:hypothetical protein